MGKPKEVKRSRTIVGWLAPILPPGRREEAHKLRLGGMDGQTVLTKALRNDFHDTAGVALVAKPYHKVIRIADEESWPTHPRPHVLFEPLIQHIVQKHIGNQGVRQHRPEVSRSLNDLRSHPP